MEVGLVRSIDIDQEMQQAYLDYAMSVIVARALPDARDGLKPVHRRILYAMYDMGVRSDSSFKKSARIVGEVLGKYHPHGDMAVYDAMARMAQDFSMRTLLVDGQGNFGSVDGDPPAAMRYTEARLSKPAMQMLADIHKNTVDFSANFDGSLDEPDVLPAALPNLLVNGATGIAVGMSTNVPPHNLGEVVDASVYMLENWERLDDIDVENLMRFIQGPDFPTGGLIIQDAEEEDLRSAYGTGRGRVTVQARAHLEEMDRGRSRIIVTELPYMTNKSALIERIAELAREGRLEGLSDLRDESDRQGLRIVIELSKSVEPEKMLQDLYKNTPMRTTFSIIMLALVNGEPHMLSLKQALRVYLEHRLEVIRRRSQFDLDKARQRAHILEGLLIALNNLDEIIDLIRKAPDADTARDRLMKKFKLSDLQAQAILDMQLRRLAALERKKIEDEYKEIKAEISRLEALLKSPVKIRQLAAEELKGAKEAFSDRRRTQIAKRGAGTSQTSAMLTTTDLVPENKVWVSISTDGLVSRSHDDTPPRPAGVATPSWCLQTTTRATVYLVAENGEAAAVFVHTIPEAENPSEGTSLHKVSPLGENQKLAGMFSLPPKEERPENQFIFTCTRQGMVKKSLVSDLPGPSSRPFILVKVNEGDRLGWASQTNGSSEVLLATADGMAIRFKEEEVRPMGLVAAGVGAIKLQSRDEVVGFEVLAGQESLLFVTSDGKAKRVQADQFPTQGRYGQGVLAWKLPRTTQLVGMVSVKTNTRITLHLDKLAPRSLRFDEAPEQTRAAAGKAILELKAGYNVVALSVQQDNAVQETPHPPSRKKPAHTAGDQSLNQQTDFTGLLEASPAKKPSASKTIPSPKPAAKAASEIKNGILKKPAGASSAKEQPAEESKPKSTAKAIKTEEKSPAQSKPKSGAKSAKNEEKPSALSATNEKTASASKAKPNSKTIKAEEKLSPPSTTKTKAAPKTAEKATANRSSAGKTKASPAKPAANPATKSKVKPKPPAK